MKLGIRNGTEVTLNILSKVVSESSAEANFRHKLLITNTQASRFCRAFTNGLAANIKLSKTHLSKIIQSGGFLARILGPLQNRLRS